MELLEQETTTGPLTHTFVRDGIPGNYDVVYQMVRVIRDSVNYDTGIEKIAKDLLINNGLDSYSSPAKQLEIIFNFVKSNVVYIEDKAGLIESIKSARVTLADGYGDCDDQTNTNATLAGCIGFEKVCIAMARYSRSDSSFVHVYCVVYDEQNNRYALDTTLPNGKFNNEVQALEVREISIFDTVPGLDGVSGLFNNVKYHAQKLGKAVIETVPVATNFLPLGFLSSHAFSTGAQLITQSGGSGLGVNALASRINQELDHIIVKLIQSQIALDLAKSQALQIASQLSTVDHGDYRNYAIVKQSIENRLNFIKDFNNFAQSHNITVVELNPNAMLCAGLAGAGIGGYMLWKLWKGSN